MMILWAVMPWMCLGAEVVGVQAEAPGGLARTWRWWALEAIVA